MNLRSIFDSVRGRMGSALGRKLNEAMFLEYAQTVIDDMAADIEFNIEDLRGQTVIDQMEYGFPRVIDPRSIRIGVIWDDATGKETDSGYELVDSTNSRRLSIRVADRKRLKSELGVD